MGWGLNKYDLARFPIKKVCNGYYIRWYYNGWHYWFFLPGQKIFATEGQKYVTLGTKKITLSTGQITFSQVKAIRTILNTREVYLFEDSGWENIRIDPGSAIVYDNQINGYEIELSAVIGSKTISKSGFSPVISVPIVIPPPIVVTSCIIGNQVWTLKNYSSNYPGSTVYNNDESNRAIYGGLYNYNMATAIGFAPTGYHVPSLAEWTTLIDFLGGSTLAGGVLKEAGTTHWYSPNVVTLPVSCFNALGGGKYDTVLGYYYDGLLSGYFMTTDQLGGWPYMIQIGYSAITALTYGTYADRSFISVRLIKDTPPQTPIIATSNCDTNIGGSLQYNNDPVLGAIYGRLYTWNMIPAIEAANPGWHVMTRQEYEITVGNYGGWLTAGGHLKEIGTSHWTVPNPADNSSVLSFLPGGAWSLVFSAFVQLGLTGNFWLDDEYSVSDGDAFVLYNTDTTASRGAHVPKGNFFSIRLVHD